uniref:Uncharacterized protein n=1 Tax=Lygus hesperus TaxID=30085 RepID=A0A0A9Y0Q8_LYGHE
MNGNYVDIFTYVFRDVEEALAFVSQVYIKVNRTGTKYSTMQSNTNNSTAINIISSSGGGNSSSGGNGSNIHNNKNNNNHNMNNNDNGNNNNNSNGNNKPISSLRGGEVFFFRAGISCGPMSTIYRAV